MHKLILGILFLSLVVAFNGCYYDVEEELYPGSQECDNTAVTFSERIQPLIVTHCQNCHDSNVMNGNISLEGYDNIKQQAENGNLMGVISHQTGYSPMPQGQPQLPQCDIEAVQAWIDNGTPND